jgi:hypothetical protein
MESAYLEETTAGNIIKGFDNYIKGSSGTTTISTGGGTATRRKGGITEQDRIFSRSSANFLRVSLGQPCGGCREKGGGADCSMIVGFPSPYVHTEHTIACADTK